MRMCWMGLIAAVGIVGVMPQDSQAFFRRAQRQECPSPSSFVDTGSSSVPNTEVEMVTITEKVKVTVYKQVTKTEQYTYTEYVRIDGRLVPVQKTGTRTIVVNEPVEEIREVTKTVPKNSPEDLAYNIRKLRVNLDELDGIVGARREELKTIQQQIDELKKAPVPAPK